MITWGREIADTREADTNAEFEAVFRSLFTEVHRMVAHLLGPGATRADVEDVTQLVFESAYRGWPRFRGESRVSTWVYGIACRVVLRQLRGFGRQRRLRDALEAEPREAHDTRTPEHTASQREEVRRLWRCLMCISPKKRVVYVMHDIEGRSAREIAEILSVPKNTVGSRLRHARQELIEKLGRTAREDER